MSCDYGCPGTNLEAICASCGHLKRHHLMVHPHRCIGVFEGGDGLRPVKSCFCPAFTRKVNAPINNYVPLDNSHQRDSFEDYGDQHIDATEIL
jgi:hypothetical protein